MRLSFAFILLAWVAFGQNPTPSITSAQPNTVDAGSPSFTLTVTGTGFTTGAVIKWSGTPLSPTTFISDTTLTATVPSTLLLICGKAPITVTNPPGTGGLTSANSVPVVVNPVLNSLDPNAVAAGSTGFTVTASGLGFSSNVVLTLFASGGRTNLSTNYLSSTTLQGFIPTSALTGVYPVSVQVSDPSSGASSRTLPITLVAADIVQIAPENIQAGGPDFTLFVLGTNVSSNAKVLWNGTPLPTVFKDGVLQATVAHSLYDIYLGAQVGISIQNPGAAPTRTLTFIIFKDPHDTEITTLDPTQADTGGPAFLLTVNGERFAKNSVIKWVSTAMPTTFVSDTKLTTTIPASLIAIDGSAPITVSTPGLTDSNSVRLFIVSPQPVITSLTPQSLTAGSPGFTMTIKGSGFVLGSTIEGLVGATAKYVSSSELSVTVPASAIANVGTYNVRVINPPGQPSIPVGNISQVAVFTALAAGTPVLTSITPYSVQVGARDFTLTANGTSFTGNASIVFNGTTLPTTRVSATQLTAVVPTSLVNQQGTATVLVANEGPVNSNSLPFTITGPQPTLSSVNPTSAPAGSPDVTLTVTGSGFLSNSTVNWNGTALATTFVSATRLTAVAPANLLVNSGQANITVTAAGATSSALPFIVGTPTPTLTTAGIVNAASSLPAVAPGALISIYGSALADGNASAGSIPLPLTLRTTTVTVNGVTAPLLFVSPGQINAQVPYETKTGTAKMIVKSGGIESAPVDFTVAATGPGVFAVPQSTHAIAVNLTDFTLNDATHPVVAGQYVTLYATGQGSVTPNVATGAGAPGTPLSLVDAQVQVQIGGKTADVQFAGLAPGFVGLMQLNVKIPDVAAGDQSVDVTVGGVKAAQTTITVK